MSVGPGMDCGQPGKEASSAERHTLDKFRLPVLTPHLSEEDPSPLWSIKTVLSSEKVHSISWVNHEHIDRFFEGEGQNRIPTISL